MYFWVRESWLLDNSIIEEPEIDDEIDFLRGTMIDAEIPNPLIFETNYEAGRKPHHFFDYGTSIPVVSGLFIELLHACGIDNFQTFPAVLRNDRSGAEWADYFAFNVIGLVNATDLDNSQCGEIAQGNDEGVPSLGVFTTLALKRELIREDLEMFREPIGGCLVMSERVIRAVLVDAPDEGIGVIADGILLT